MASPKRDLGPVESAWKAWTDSLGDALTLRQKATAAQLLGLARRLDAAPDEPLSAAGSVSRELRALADELRDAGHVGAVPEPDEVTEKIEQAAPDPVTNIQEARRKRQQSLGR